MPSPSTQAELFERLRAVETALTSHTAECGIRNQQRLKWEEEIDRDVSSLKLDRAKALGYMLGMAAGGGALGCATIEAIVKFFG